MAELDLSTKPDAAQALERMEAWWNMAILDRPCVQVAAPRPGGPPWPTKQYPTIRDKWMDAEYAVECAIAGAKRTYWGGEIMPQFFPNLGPEVMTAAYGAELEFSEYTSWSIPCLLDWDDLPKLTLDAENIYVRQILKMTQMGLEAGKGIFLTGHTDLHPGADLASSLRDPEQFCIDLALEPELSMELLVKIKPAFYEFFELQHKLMREAGQTVSVSWLPLFTEGKYYIPSNDFSCMVSNEMFRKFFLWEVVEECQWLDRSIYHLDGPGALQHLDDLLAIPELGAVQWVFGAGNEPASRWMNVYKRIQAGGKGIHASIEVNELDFFMENLNPEGVMLSMWASSINEADEIIARVAKWTKAGSF